MFEKDSLNLERRMVRERMLAQERPYRSTERDPLPARKWLNDEEAEQLREHEATRGQDVEQSREQRLKMQEQELAQKRQYEREREQRLQEREQELAQRRHFEQEREQRMQARQQELSQRRSRGAMGGAGTPSGSTGGGNNSGPDYAAAWEAARGRGAAPTAAGTTDAAAFDRLSPQDRLLAQKRVVDDERARMNRERTLDRGHGLYLDRSLNRKRATIPDYELNQELDPEITWQGGMGGLREMLTQNKMLLIFLAVLAFALVLMVIILIVRGG